MPLNNSEAFFIANYFITCTMQPFYLYIIGLIGIMVIIAIFLDKRVK